MAASGPLEISSGHLPPAKAERGKGEYVESSIAPFMARGLGPIAKQWEGEGQWQPGELEKLIEKLEEMSLR
jgi:hypothetical protein